MQTMNWNKIKYPENKFTYLWSVCTILNTLKRKRNVSETDTGTRWAVSNWFVIQMYLKLVAVLLTQQLVGLQY